MLLLERRQAATYATLGDMWQADQGKFFSTQYLRGCTWTAVPGFGPPSAVRMLRCWRGFSRALPRWSEACEEALKKRGVLSVPEEATEKPNSNQQLMGEWKTWQGQTLLGSSEEYDKR